MIFELTRSSGVIERMIAAVRSRSRSSMFLICSFICPAPGSMPSRFAIGPILRIAIICSRKSSSVKPSREASLPAIRSACSASKCCSACSMRVSTSPMPRMREAIRSGWKTSKSVSFSPVEANMIGWPVTYRTDSAAPPRASPSSLVEDDAGEADALLERLGGGDGVLADHRVDDEQRLVGLHGVADAGGLRHQLGVDAQPAGGVDDDDVVHGAAGVLDRVRATATGSPTPLPGSGA